MRKFGHKYFALWQKTETDIKSDNSHPHSNYLAGEHSLLLRHVERQQTAVQCLFRVAPKGMV